MISKIVYLQSAQLDKSTCAPSFCDVGAAFAAVLAIPWCDGSAIDFVAIVV